MTSLSQRLPLLYKFLILGLAGILMSAVPTWLFVSGALDDLARARHEARYVFGYFRFTHLSHVIYSSYNN